jgi:hypothetical protein
MGVHWIQIMEKKCLNIILFNRPNTLKLSSLFNKKKPETVRKLCKLIDIINMKISSPWKKSITPLYVQLQNFIASDIDNRGSL